MILLFFSYISIFSSVYFEKVNIILKINWKSYCIMNNYEIIHQFFEIGSNFTNVFIKIQTFILNSLALELQVILIKSSRVWGLIWISSDPQPLYLIKLYIYIYIYFFFFWKLFLSLIGWISFELPGFRTANNFIKSSCVWGLIWISSNPHLLYLIKLCFSFFF